MKLGSRMLTQLGIQDKEKEALENENCEKLKKLIIERTGSEELLFTLKYNKEKKVITVNHWKTFNIVEGEKVIKITAIEILNLIDQGATIEKSYMDTQIIQ